MRRSVRFMADKAPLPKGLVLKNKGTHLFAVATSAGFIEPGPTRAAGRPGDVHTVGIVTGAATHSALEDRMPGRLTEFALRIQMTVQTDVRVAAGVENESPPTASGRHMKTARTVAEFAAGRFLCARHPEGDPRVDIGREHAHQVGMALVTGGVAHQIRPFDPWRLHHGRVQGGTASPGEEDRAGTGSRPDQPTSVRTGERDS